MKGKVLYFVFLMCICSILFFIQSCSINNIKKELNVKSDNGTLIDDKIKKTAIPISTIEPKSIVYKEHKAIPILYYHSITDDIFGIEELHVSPSEFDKQMKYVTENYNSIGFEELENVNYYENPAIITFDDGYKDNYTEAYPILKKYGLKATIYINPDKIGKKNRLTKSDIKDMMDIISFNSHTFTHCDLLKVNDEQMKREIVDSKKAVEDLTGKPSISFCYPFGHYNDKVIDLVSKHYKYAVSIKSGLHDFKTNYEIKRVYIPRNLDIESFKLKIKKGVL